jgi:hypothetical protein
MDCKVAEQDGASLMRYLKDFFVVIIGPILGTLVTFYPFESRELVYIRPNLAFIASPHIAWWLLCVIWWAVWTPVRNRSLLYGGIAGADLFLLYMVWPWFLGTPRGEMSWLFYIYYCLPVVVVTGAVCGFIEMVKRED